MECPICSHFGKKTCDYPSNKASPHHKEHPSTHLDLTNSNTWVASQLNSEILKYTSSNFSSSSQTSSFKQNNHPQTLSFPLCSSTSQMKPSQKNSIIFQQKANTFSQNMTHKYCADTNINSKTLPNGWFPIHPVYEVGYKVKRTPVQSPFVVNQLLHKSYN